MLMFFVAVICKVRCGFCGVGCLLVLWSSYTIFCPLLLQPIADTRGHQGNELQLADISPQQSDE